MSKEKDEEQYCLACNELLNKEDQKKDKFTLSISCGQYHFLCNDCFHSYLNSCFQVENIMNKIPICCPYPKCNQEYYVEKVFLLLNEKEYDLYTEQLVKSNKFMDVNEIFVSCPFCKFGIIYTKDNIPNFFYCYDSEKCGRMSCTICCKQVTYNEAYEEYNDLDEITYTEKDPEYHFKCFEHKYYYENFQKCLEEGSMNKCPSCGYKGQKDENCCHMICGNCSENWCYCCMKKIEKGSDHWNDNFIDDPKSCPLYLDLFSEHYDDWPEDENYATDNSNNKSVVFYHEQKTFYLLQNEILKCGVLKVKQLISYFSNLLNNLDFDDIMKFELTKPLKLRFDS